jgi:hypothetical protein
MILRNQEMLQVLERDMERNQALELVVPVQQGVGLLMVEMEVEVPLVVVITVLEVQDMTINVYHSQLEVVVELVVMAALELVDHHLEWSHMMPCFWKGR